jgi:hypothetical protein
MNRAKKKRVPAKQAASDSTVELEGPRELKQPSDDDSEQIERAVYDGMQDLRVPKPRRK